MAQDDLQLQAICSNTRYTQSARLNSTCLVLPEVLNAMLGQFLKTDSGLCAC